MTLLIAAACEFNRDETCASLPEYALLLVLIAVICVAAMSALGSQISNVMMALASSL
jgi:Flp pilus assembly pilin Flp